jgi:hypothetical protein
MKVVETTRLIVNNQVSTTFADSEVCPTPDHSVTGTSLRRIVTPTDQPPDSIVKWSGEWVLVFTKPRAETRAIRELAERDGIQVFRPTHELVRVDTDIAGHRHTRRERRPMFPNYLSYCVRDPEERYRITSHDTTAAVIPIIDQQRFIVEMSAVEIATTQPVEIMPLKDLQPGARVTVTGGPYRGYVGVLIAKRKRTLFAIEITTLGRAILLEIDPADLSADI